VKKVSWLVIVVVVWITLVALFWCLLAVAARADRPMRRRPGGHADPRWPRARGRQPVGARQPVIAAGRSARANRDVRPAEQHQPAQGDALARGAVARRRRAGNDAA
jgi:hypothetical protein